MMKKEDGWWRITDGKHTGWFEEEWLCGRSVTTCP